MSAIGWQIIGGIIGLVVGVILVVIFELIRGGSDLS